MTVMLIDSVCAESEWFVIKSDSSSGKTECGWVIQRKGAFKRPALNWFSCLQSHWIPGRSRVEVCLPFFALPVSMSTGIYYYLFIEQSQF